MNYCVKEEILGLLTPNLVFYSLFYGQAMLVNFV
jgi:hypothetical protein